MTITSKTGAIVDGQKVNREVLPDVECLGQGCYQEVCCYSPQHSV